MPDSCKTTAETAGHEPGAATLLDVVMLGRPEGQGRWNITVAYLMHRSICLNVECAALLRRETINRTVPICSSLSVITSDWPPRYCTYRQTTFVTQLMHHCLFRSMPRRILTNDSDV